MHSKQINKNERFTINSSNAIEGKRVHTANTNIDNKEEKLHFRLTEIELNNLDNKDLAYNEYTRTLEQIEDEFKQSGDIQMLKLRAICEGKIASVAPKLKALSFAEAAKKDAESVISINAEIADPYVTLAILYFKVPGWPIGFGDKKKSEELFKKALSMKESSIALWKYAEFLIEEGRDSESIFYLEKAAELKPQTQEEHLKRELVLNYISKELESNDALTQSNILFKYKAKNT